MILQRLRPLTKNVKNWKPKACSSTFKHVFLILAFYSTNFVEKEFRTIFIQLKVSKKLKLTLNPPRLFNPSQNFKFQGENLSRQPKTEFLSDNFVCFHVILANFHYTINTNYTISCRRFHNCNGIFGILSLK